MKQSNTSNTTTQLINFAQWVSGSTTALVLTGAIYQNTSIGEVWLRISIAIVPSIILAIGLEWAIRKSNSLSTKEIAEKLATLAASRAEKSASDKEVQHKKLGVTAYNQAVLQIINVTKLISSAFLSISLIGISLFISILLAKDFTAAFLSPSISGAFNFFIPFISAIAMLWAVSAFIIQECNTIASGENKQIEDNKKQIQEAKKKETIVKDIKPEPKIEPKPKNRDADYKKFYDNMMRNYNRGNLSNAKRYAELITNQTNSSYVFEITEGEVIRRDRAA